MHEHTWMPEITLEMLLIQITAFSANSLFFQVHDIILHMKLSFRVRLY